MSAAAIERITTDILILGSGGAGLFAALHAHRADPGLDITIATKDVFPLIAEADLVKMNIEGSEWDVLRDPRLASTSVSWIVEYHRIANPDPDIHGLIGRLFKAAGYTVRQAQEGENNGLLWAWRA